MDPELKKWLAEINNRVWSVQQRLQELERQLKWLLDKAGFVPPKSQELPFWRDDDITPVKG